MRVLVTGGAGFVGRAVVSRLAETGHTARVYDRAADPADDVLEPARVRAALSGCDAVVHLAAKVGLGLGLDDLDDYVRTNDLGTAVVLQAAAARSVGRLVYASSMVVYGEGAYACPEHGATQPPPRRAADLERGRFDPLCPVCGADLLPGLVPETAPLDPRNVYAATKVHGEHLARSWARETEGTVVALRLHNVYGPGMPRDTPYAGVAALFASALARGEAPQVFEDGRQRRNFVHVRDVAKDAHAHVSAMATALSRSTGGPEPVVTGQYRLGDVRHITADCGAAERVLGWRAARELPDLDDLVSPPT